jgi:hypothetical protein
MERRAALDRLCRQQPQWALLLRYTQGDARHTTRSTTSLCLHVQQVISQHGIPGWEFLFRHPVYMCVVAGELSSSAPSWSLIHSAGVGGHSSSMDWAPSASCCRSGTIWCTIRCAATIRRGCFPGGFTDPDADSLHTCGAAYVSAKDSIPDRWL